MRISKPKKNEKKLVRIVLALMLAVMMAVTGIVPASAFAEEGEGEGQTQTTEQTQKADPPEEKTEAKATEPQPEPTEQQTEAPTQEPEQKNEEPEQKNEEPEQTSDEPTEQKSEDENQNWENGDKQTNEMNLKETPDPTQKVTEETTPSSEEEEEPEEKMPAQSFSGSAGGVSVKASAGEGVFPEGTKMKVSSVSSSYVIAAANKATGGDLTIVDAAAVDINFYKGGSEIQPEDGSVKVSLNAGSVGGEEQEAVHVTSGGGVEIIGGASSGHASFSANHFSIYGIIGGNYENDEQEYARYTYVFKVNGEEVDRQIVKDGESLSAPETPKDNGFLGWREAGSFTDFDFSTPVSIPETVKEDKEITVNAVFAEEFYATFYKDETKSQVLATKSGETGKTVITYDVTYVFADGKAIVGWKDGSGKEVRAVTFTDSDIELTPIISNAAVQVTFDTGEGTPVSPVFVEKNKTLTAPDTPTRSGYTFKGWFTDPACEHAYDFNTKVTESFTLYAKWEGKKTAYRVAHWKQNANDNGYTFVEMETKTDNAGLAASYTAKKYDGFTLNATRSNTVVPIKGDGTTIKNVYYDRNIYDLTFYVKEGKKWKEKETYSFKYEQATDPAWTAMEAKYSGYLWYVDTRQDVAWSSAPAMPKGGIKAYGVSNDGRSEIYYYEYINGSKTTNEVKPKFVANRLGWSFTPEDYVAIPGFTYAKVKDEPKWKKNFFGTVTEQESPGKLYYTRNNYGIQFITNGGPSAAGGNKVSGIPYEASLVKYAPSNYIVGQTTRTENGVTYTFTGWYTDETLQKEFDFNSKMPALEVVLQGSGDKSTMVLYAGWTAGKHTVAFDLNGGTYDGKDAIAPQTVESGTQATALDKTKMVKDGYTFIGWKDESGKMFSFDAKITKDYQLTAVWNDEKTRFISIRYETNGGTGTVSDGRMYQDGSYAVIAGQPAAPKGQYFAGWKIGSSDIVQVSGSFQVKGEDTYANTKSVADNSVLTMSAQYADLPEHTTTVIYNANGGTIRGGATYEDKNAVVNGNYTIIEDKPEFEGYDFLGWSTDPGAASGSYKGGETTASGKGANVLYAIWVKVPGEVVVTITGKKNTVHYDGSEQKVEGYDVSIDDPEYTEDDFRFTGEAVAKGTEVGIYYMGLNSSMFQNTNKNFKVAFIVEDGYLEIEKMDFQDDDNDDNNNDNNNNNDEPDNNNDKPDNNNNNNNNNKKDDNDDDMIIDGDPNDDKIDPSNNTPVPANDDTAPDNGKTTGTDGNGSDGSAGTGDDSLLALYLALMLAALAGGATVAYRKRSADKVR